MSLLAFVSAKRSPGTTTAALALASVWPGRPALVVECDPAGGDLAADAGLPVEPGLTSLAATRRHGFSADHLAGHAQRFPCGATVIVAPPSSDGARLALSTLSGRLAAGLAALNDVDVFADCGRLGSDSVTAPLLAAARLVVVVLRPTLGGVEHVAARIDELRGTVNDVGLLLVGEDPYPAKEVAAYLGCDVAGVLADDPVGAAVLPTEQARRRLKRSALLRSARSTADGLVRRLDATPLARPLIPATRASHNGASSHTIGGRR